MSAAPLPFDARMMELALELARESRPSPNPRVGAVIVRDGAIVGRVRASRSPKQITVVTDDKTLTNAVKDSGATVVPVEQLTKWLAETQDDRRRGKPRPDTGVGKEITEDLKDVWGA